jgi:hypothetical protein
MLNSKSSNALQLTGDMLASSASLVQIPFDMMLRGYVVRRGRDIVRQAGVVVDGSVRIVTSGDWVGRNVYRALLKSGVIRPVEEHMAGGLAPVPGESAPEGA